MGEIVNKYFFGLIFILFFLNARAETVSPELVTNPKPTIWKNYVISERIDPQGEDVDKNIVDEKFKNKTVSLDNENVTITGVCRYKFNKEKMSPIKYWKSKNTVDLYKRFFSTYNVKLNDELILITPMNPSVDCEYPFSYFIEVNDSLIFVLKNRAVIYSLGNEAMSAPTGECTHKNQTPEQVYENGDIDECYYKSVNIVDAYRRYRNGMTGESSKYLQGDIVSNKDFSMKCYDGCINVEYKWNGSDNLTIKQLFDGGETDISFITEKKGVRVITKSFPD